MRRVRFFVLKIKQSAAKPWPLDGEPFDCQFASPPAEGEGFIKDDVLYRVIYENVAAPKGKAQYVAEEDGNGNLIAIPIRYLVAEVEVKVPLLKPSDTIPRATPMEIGRNRR